MQIESFLARLTRVRQSASGQWRASCPTAFHSRGDRSASLSIKEGDDGRILIHCPAGCHAEFITAALGLTLADLFKEPERVPGSAIARSPGYLSKDVATVLAYDAVTASIALDHVASGYDFSADDLAQVKASAGRLYRFAQRVGGSV